MVDVPCVVHCVWHIHVWYIDVADIYLVVHCVCERETANSYLKIL